MFDHSKRTTKYFDPQLGACVCEHCTALPWHEPLSTTIVTTEQLVNDATYETYVPTAADEDIIGRPLAERLGDHYGCMGCTFCMPDTSDI